MTAQTKTKVERTAQSLGASTLPEDTKDGLMSLLDAASHAANGTQDRVGAMADAILALSLHEVRQAIRQPAMMQAAVDAHTASCPLAVAGRKGAVMALLMRPWPWVAVSVASFSPHFPGLVDAVRGAL